jgi:DNA repair exonuclease SbcCD nuclease subunit
MGPGWLRPDLAITVRAGEHLVEVSCVMTCFIHTADWQLGKPFASVADVAKRSRIQQERIEGIRRIRDMVLARQAAFVLVAGDLFDSPTPTRTVVAQALGVIGEIPVPVYAIPGNHDHGGPGCLWEQPFFVAEHRARAPNLHVLLERRPVERDDVVILPCPLLHRHETSDPTAWIRTLDFEACGHRPRIVLVHGSVTTFGTQADDEEIAGPPNVVTIDSLPLADLDYVALGDWHGFTEAGPKSWYSGSHEPDRFPKQGQRPGHVACITVSRGGQPVVEPLPTSRLAWLHAELDLGDDGPARVEETLAAVTSAAGFDRCLVDLTLRGRVSLAARRQLDEVLESWSHRLLRLDIRDTVTLSPSADEIHDLAERADDPIISRVATELVRLLEAGGDAAADAREAVNILHGLCSEAGRAAR